MSIDEFKAKTATDLVLVVFHADWCGPCRAFYPVLEALAPDYTGKIDMSIVDMTDDDGEGAKIGSDNGVRAVPTCMIFRSGKFVAQKVGALKPGQLRDFLDGTLASV